MVFRDAPFFTVDDVRKDHFPPVLGGSVWVVDPKYPRSCKFLRAEGTAMIPAMIAMIIKMQPNRVLDLLALFNEVVKALISPRKSFCCWSIISQKWAVDWLRTPSTWYSFSTSVLKVAETESAAAS